MEAHSKLESVAQETRQKRELPGPESPLSFVRFLDRVFVFVSVRRPCPISFKRHVPIGPVYAHNTNADRISPGRLECPHLFYQIADHSIDLLDHGLGQDLDFGSNLYGRNRTLGYGEPGNDSCFSIGDDLAKGAVSTASFDPTKLISPVQDRLPGIHSVVQFCRAPQQIEVFRETRSNRIAEAGIAVPVGRSVKQVPETLQQEIRQIFLPFSSFGLRGLQGEHRPEQIR